MIAVERKMAGAMKATIRATASRAQPRASLFPLYGRGRHLCDDVDVDVDVVDIDAPACEGDIPYSLLVCDTTLR